MKEYYAKNYIDEMKRVGYKDLSDFAMEMFYSYFSECENNKEYRAHIKENRKDFQKFCAAYAQLKTNLTIGCSNDITYDIKGTSKNYVFRGGGVGRSPTHSPFAFRRKAKGEVFRGALKSFLHLSKDEFDSYVEVLPTRLANCAKGAFYLFHQL